MRKYYLHWVMALALCMSLSCAHTAYATDEFDLSVELKTLPLLTNKISGTTVIAVIYNPAVPDSKTEANNIKELIDSGMEAPGEVKLSARLVSTTDLSGLGDSKIGVVAKGACTEEMSTAATAKGILTISSELDCVRAHRCIIGVISRPNVRIFLSRSAADAAHVEFSKAFIMLVKQV